MMDLPLRGKEKKIFSLFFVSSFYSFFFFVVYLSAVSRGVVKKNMEDIKGENVVL